MASATEWKKSSITGNRITLQLDLRSVSIYYDGIMRQQLPLFLVLLLVMMTGCSEPDQPTIGLYLAVHRSDIDQIERHIYWGADINKADADGRMPLHVATGKGRLVVVNLLLKHGAEIDAQDHNGHPPLYTALMEGRTQVAQLLIRKGARFDADQLLEQVARNGIADRDVLTLLIAQGADIDRIGGDGNTPLLLAIDQGDRVLAKQLITHGADVSRPGTSGIAPLHLAKQRNYEDIIRLLKRNGAID